MTKQNLGALFFILALSAIPLQASAQDEVLPTTSPAGYWWERVAFNIEQAFTFNSEKKAAKLQNRLDRLDNKAATCAELGNEECLNKIEEHRSTLEERTEKFIARRSELKEKLQAGFEEKKQRSEARRANIKEKLEARRLKHNDHVENLQEKKQENRENLIEFRSKNVKDKLDNTRDQVKWHETRLKQNLRSNGSTVDLEVSDTTEVTGNAEVETTVQVDVNIE